MAASVAGSREGRKISLRGVSGHPVPVGTGKTTEYLVGRIVLQRAQEPGGLPSTASTSHVGKALINTQQVAAAEKEFREALPLEPSAQNDYTLAACLMALNQYEDALGEPEIASLMDPSQNLYRARMQELVRLIGKETN